MEKLEPNKKYTVEELKKFKLYNPKEDMEEIIELQVVEGFCQTSLFTEGHSIQEQIDKAIKNGHRGDEVEIYFQERTMCKSKQPIAKLDISIESVKCQL